MNGFAEEPRVSYSAHMGKAEFFAWLQTKEGGRYELKNGEIVVHAGSTMRHAGLSARFLHALMVQLDADTWLVAGSDAAIEVGDDIIRYPDVVVVRRGPTQTWRLRQIARSSSSRFYRRLPWDATCTRRGPSIQACRPCRPTSSPARTNPSCGLGSAILRQVSFPNFPPRSKVQSAVSISTHSISRYP